MSNDRSGTKGQISNPISTGTSKPVPEGMIILSTSAGNRLIFEDPAQADIYRAQHRAQFGANGGNYNDQTQRPS